MRPGLRSSLDVRKKAARRRPSLASAPIGSSSDGLWRLGGRERLTGGCQIVDRSGCATGIGHASSHRIHPRDRSDSRRRPVAALPNIPPRSDVRHSPFWGYVYCSASAAIGIGPLSLQNRHRKNRSLASENGARLCPRLPDPTARVDAPAAVIPLRGDSDETARLGAETRPPSP